MSAPDLISPLEAEIRRRIAREGPLPIADYMSLCLAHPEHGYYTTGYPVGGRASSEREGGDFITAPEISQMFGEMIGIWCMEVWQALGSPHPFTLAEIGPGRGTLMNDLLRVSKALPAFLKAVELHLVEISPTLAEQQSLTLSSQPVGLKWVRDISALPDQPTIVIANELLDALPLRQWVKTENGWQERGIGLINDKLTYVSLPTRLAEIELPPDHEKQAVGTIFETAPAREALVSGVADHVARNTGAALFLDYGGLETGFGDTFQAVREHNRVHPLSRPGRCDLTSHVDFERLVQTVRDMGCALPQPVEQGTFLLNLGLLERAGSLGSGRPEHVQDALRAAVNRLAGPDQMGELFKAFAFGAPASLGERWPGFV